METILQVEYIPTKTLKKGSSSKKIRTFDKLTRTYQEANPPSHDPVYRFKTKNKVNTNLDREYLKSEVEYGEYEIAPLNPTPFHTS